MAKPKTASKRTASSSSKKASNKSSSGKGLSKRFSLQSRKVQFFVFIFVVALLGGGWFTYKSFAATDMFQAGNNTLLCRNICELKNDYSEDSSGNKSTITVINIKKGGSARPNRSVYLYGNKQYRVCVNGRREINNLAGVIDVKVSGRYGSPTALFSRSARAVFNHQDFTKYLNKCQTLQGFIPTTGYYDLTYSNSVGNPVYVATTSIFPASEGK